MLFGKWFYMSKAFSARAPASTASLYSNLKYIFLALTMMGEVKLGF
jgi:hypothetical protein